MDASLSSPDAWPRSGALRPAPAKLGLTIEDLRRYCLEMLRSRRALDDDTPDYLRGYREGFQLVLRDLRELE